MFGVSLSKSKTNVSFVPGIGMETTFTKNWVGRIEGTYDLGYKVSASKNITTVGVGLVPVTTTEKFTASSGKVANLAVKLGIAYKI
jgi:opacity protein-like surface antigen